MADERRSREAASAERRLLGPGGDWSLAPVLAWMFEEAGALADPVAIVGELCERLVAAGAPLSRVRVAVRVLHPRLRAWGGGWRRGRGAEELRFPRGIEATPAYRGTPIERLDQTGEPQRHRLDRLGPDDHALLQALAAEGGTDYLLLPMTGGRQRSLIALSTDRPGGFTDADVETFEALARALGLGLDVAAGELLARTLLDTYLGPRTGAPVLDGRITRGDGVTIRAAVWFSDLRDFTATSRDLPSDALLELLNAYFDLVAEAIAPAGGEILKFLGDGVLVVFPAEDEGGERAACAAAVKAALDLLDRAGRANAGRVASGLRPVSFGIGLHAGAVTYGNIGSADRLDFTMIGPAVNLAQRLEALTREVGRPLLVSAEVAGQAGRPMASVGRFALKGVGDPVEAFAPGSGRESSGEAGIAQASSKP